MVLFFDDHNRYVSNGSLCTIASHKVYFLASSLACLLKKLRHGEMPKLQMTSRVLKRCEKHGRSPNRAEKHRQSPKCAEKCPSCIDFLPLIGVVDTGLFINMADTVIIGNVDGSIEVLKKD